MDGRPSGLLSANKGERMQDPDIVLPGRIPSKKNNKKWAYSRRHGRKVLVSSDNYTRWHRDATLELLSQRPKKHAGVIDSVEIEFWMPDNIKADLTNKAESVMDLLVDNDILVDDSWQYVPQVLLRVAGIDRKDPRVLIWIHGRG